MILLLTEAGDGIGFGHLARMMAVGEALLAKGVKPLMVVQWEGMPLAEILEGREWVISGDWRDDLAALIARHEARGVLVDSYRLLPFGYQSILTSGAKLAVIDDFYRLPYPAHLVINPNVFGDSARYLNHAQQAVAGVDFVILRPPLVQAARSFEVRHEITRVLLTLGGSDVHNLGEKLARALAKHWDIGWIAPDQSLQSGQIDRVTILGTQSADGMVRQIRASDLVVCGGGQTLHELACVGVPCVALELGDDQKLNLSFYERAGCLGARLHWSTISLVEDTVCRVSSLASFAERRRLADTARNLIDGNGAKRIAALLAELIN